MKKLGLLLMISLLSVAGNHLFAQCSPDTTLMVPGYYPDTLVDATVGQPYDASFTAVFPQDTSVDVGFFKIDACFQAFKLDSSTFANLPAGISYECDVPGCIWLINQDSGVVNRGCVRFFGTPTASLPNDTLTAVIKVEAGTFDTLNNVCDSLVLPPGIPPSLIDVFLTQEVNLKFFILDTTSTAIDQQLAERFVKPVVFPNPSQGQSTLKYTLPEASDISVSIMDMMGRTISQVYAGRTRAGIHHLDLPTQGLANGVYFVRLGLENGEVVLTRKLTIRH